MKTNANKINHYVYRVEMLSSGEFYIGSRSTDKEINKDSYKGSMINWKLNKFEKLSLKKTIIKSDFENRKDAINFESDLITYHINNPLCKNKHVPNRGFHTFNCVSVKDQYGNNLSVDKNDPRYLNGELIPVRKGKSTVIDLLGNISSVDSTDERIINGELNYLRKNKVTLKDDLGNYYLIDKNDPRYLNKELVGICKDTITVKDSNGNKMRVSKDDPRFLNGELVHNMKNLVSVKDINGKKFITNIDNPLYLTGVLVGICKDTITVKDSNGNKMRVSKDDPRFLNGELVGVSKGLIAANVKLKIEDKILFAKDWSIKFGISHKNLKTYLESNNIQFVKITTRTNVNNI